MTPRKPPPAIASNPLVPTRCTNNDVTTGPAIAPRLPPAVIAGNSRADWVDVKISTIKLQNTDTMNRLTTLNHQ
jgi:hypothetical protein